MRSVRLGLPLCFLLLLNSHVGAQEAPVSGAIAADDKQALALLQASLVGLMASTKVPPATLSAAGTITPLLNSTAIAYPVRVHVKGSDKFRWEEDLPQGTTTAVINGQDAQSQLGSTDGPLMPLQIGVRRVENFPILLLARWLASSNLQLNFVGLEVVDGQNLNHISIVDLTQRFRLLNPWHRDENRGQYELYLDPVTSYPVRLHYYQDTSDTHYFSLVPVDIVYSDFRVTGGLVFPFTLTRYRGEHKLAILQFQTIQPNGSVSDQDFQIR